jgi:hypothetical protein
MLKIVPETTARWPKRREKVDQWVDLDLFLRARQDKYFSDGLKMGLGFDRLPMGGLPPPAFPP